MLYNQTVLSNENKENVDFVFFQDLIKSPCFSISKNLTDLEVLYSPAFKKWERFKNFLIFGTGGSSLGGQSICSISSESEKNIRFVDNLDPISLENIFSKMDPLDTGFLFISKSGETLETLGQLFLLIAKLRHVPDFEEHMLIITEAKSSTLREVAEQNGFTCLDHPTEIGGRYSVFSLVGMVPAVLCGLQPKRIRTGGRRVLDNFGNSIYKIQEGANFVYQNFASEIKNHVSFIYSDKLFCFGRWLAQLYAESSGKKGKGITPLLAQGSIDQHSQLQLYLDGPHDKCFTFFVEKYDSNISFDEEIVSAKFDYLKGKSLSAVFQSQSMATMKTLTDKKIHVRKIEVPPVDEEILGALFMHFMLEAACVCRLMEVNPFDQPAVEAGKIITKELLSEK